MKGESVGDKETFTEHFICTKCHNECITDESYYCAICGEATGKEVKKFLVKHVRI
jgi:ribosomal protein L37E